MQARSSDGLGQLAHSTPAPHRRCSAVAPRTRRRAATPFRFPIRVRRSVCCPTMTTADGILTMHVPSLVRLRISLCPRCFRCVSSFCPNSLHTHAMYVPLNAYSQATQGARMVHVHVHADDHARVTHCPHIGHRTGKAFDPRFPSHGNSTHCAQTCMGFPFLCGRVTDRTLYPYAQA